MLDRRLIVALAACVAAAVGLASCHQAILTAPPGSTIVVSANPQIIPANGGVAIITAMVAEPMGTLVPDGTVVQFFTTMGRIDAQGKTSDGIARVNLVSDSRSGKATVRACSGGNPSTTSSPATGSTTGTTTAAGMQCADLSDGVQIGNAAVANVVVTANPQRIRFAPRQSEIVANVYDTNGDPMANAAVFFSVSTNVPGATPGSSTSDPPIYESLASRGAPVFTDNNGRAYDTLATSYSAAERARWVYVTASAGQSSAVKSGTVTIQIN